MPQFTDVTVNAMLDAIAALGTHLSAHTAFPGNTGTNEVTGGSPAYARKSITWGSAASRSKSWTGDLTFDIPAATTVSFLGLWSASTSGTWRGYLIVGSTGQFAFAIDEATDKVLCDNHGYSNGDQVVFVGDTAPTGLTEGTIYFVVSSAQDEFKVAATSGGSAIDITGDGGPKSRVSKIVPETFGAQGQFVAKTTSTVSI